MRVQAFSDGDGNGDGDGDGDIVSKEKNSQKPLVSFLSEIPAPIKQAMEVFIESYPSWDQYRLIQAALAGFLIQHGSESRQITRLYVDNMFSKKPFQ